MVQEHQKAGHEVGYAACRVVSGEQIAHAADEGHCHWAVLLLLGWTYAVSLKRASNQIVVYEQGRLWPRHDCRFWID